MLSWLQFIKDQVIAVNIYFNGQQVFYTHVKKRKGKRNENKYLLLNFKKNLIDQSNWSQINESGLKIFSVMDCRRKSVSLWKSINLSGPLDDWSLITLNRVLSLIETYKKTTTFILTSFLKDFIDGFCKRWRKQLFLRFTSHK